MERMTFSISPELKAKLESCASYYNLSMSDVIRIALSNYVDRYNGTGTKPGQFDVKWDPNTFMN